MKTFAIIPAGGKGIRGGSAAPKQYLKFGGKELIAYTLDVFQKNRLVDEIIISSESTYFTLLWAIKEKYKFTKVKQIVEGGRERQDSVYNALKSLNAEDEDLVIVHDAARPLLPSDILTEAIKTAKEKSNALVCVKVSDTLVKADDVVDYYVNREGIYYVQTPQIFRYIDLLNAMISAYENNFYGTDESMLIKRMNQDVHIVEGSFINFKVTTKSDIDLLQNILKK
ncbi:MAG TPA: 2-C-methyl-D-erythritol 4-phosphate cytidylyltransferase [Ignavibacteriaceae bacterium]|nr:2-C-methyl-D-erythritol 4-phosphate cytidylyltransferase [Ignavibacteriaceae bacterium]